uniref:Cytoplasmic polyadenylation element-binding protein ZZ domain-containing protein n=2 Tax=Parascaris univalens TaxID=6257 RepID=A0A915A150_PARUN
WSRCNAGSGRVTFASSASYFRVFNSDFLEIKTLKFSKRIQIEPYLEYSKCSPCGSARGPYFCREKSCFKYYCLQCWQARHDSAGPYGVHRALMRKSRRLSRFEVMDDDRHHSFMIGYPTVAAQNSGCLIHRSGGVHQGAEKYASAQLSAIDTPTQSTRWMTPRYANPGIAQNMYCRY